MKKILYILVLLFIFPLISLASNDFDVSDYNVNIEVKKNHVYNYEEKLKVKFFGNQKYIIRNIIDDEHNLKLNRNYTIETNETSIAKIYAESNEDTIKSTYNYSVPNERNNYYRLKIKNNYEEKIETLKFKLVLPAPITSNNIKILNGTYDITGLVDFTVKDNIVTGTYNKNLDVGSSITIEIDYGRFYMSSATLICIIIPAILAVFSYLLWRLFGKDLPAKIEKTSKFARNVSALHIALANNGEVTEDDTFCMLLDLAVKGYITIVEKDDDYYLLRNKNYNESNYLESVFFKTLFRAGESISLTEYINIMQERRDNNQKIYQADRVESSRLKRKFTLATNTITKILDERNEKSKYFEEKPEKIKNILLLMVATILILITSLPFVEINVLTLLPLSIIISIALLYVLIIFVRNINIKNETHKSIIVFTIATIILVIILVPSFQRNIGFLIAFLTSLLSSGIILFIYKYMPKRTIYGQKIYNKILGFKAFINNINDEELKRILEINDNYLNEVIPIAYQLGLEEKVISLLKKKPKEETWFQLDGKFTYGRLHHSILKLKNKVTKKDE